jgi:hypothetical protein
VERTLYLIQDQLDRIERKLAAQDRSNVIEMWLAKAELAKALGVSVRWIEQRMTEGLPHREIAGKRVFRLTVAEEWLRRRGYVRDVA